MGAPRSNLAPRYRRRVLCVISALFLCFEMGQTKIIEFKHTKPNSCRSALTRSVGYESVLRPEGGQDVRWVCAELQEPNEIRIIKKQGGGFVHMQKSGGEG